MQLFGTKTGLRRPTAPVDDALSVCASPSINGEGSCQLAYWWSYVLSGALHLASPSPALPMRRRIVRKHARRPLGPSRYGIDESPAGPHVETRPSSHASSIPIHASTEVKQAGTYFTHHSPTLGDFQWHWSSGGCSLPGLFLSAATNMGLRMSEEAVQKAPCRGRWGCEYDLSVSRRNVGRQIASASPYRWATCV